MESTTEEQSFKERHASRIRLAILSGLAWIVFTIALEVYILLVPMVPMALVLAAVFAAPAARQAHTNRQLAILKVKDHTRWPKLFANTLELDKGEEVIHESRMNPIVILWNKWLLIPVFLLVLGVWSRLLVLFPAAVLLAALVSVPGFVNWWFTRRCFTTWRIIEATGILRKIPANVTLTSIDNAYHIEEAWLNKILRLFGLPEVCHWHFDTRIKEKFNDLWWSTIDPRVSDIFAPYIKGKSQP